ncbi:RraA family protein [Actinomadura napierensis]|uniref:RraA family protein n=1 Tax=Actinomadura napierensis TaxID=267854 RepID=A0ABN3A9U9_9ACTN
MTTPDRQVFEQLRYYDTPTICNALELIDDSRRWYGFTKSDVTAINRTSAPAVGVAFTATMRSAYPAEFDREQLKRDRLSYYEYMYEVVAVPKICVMQDLDDSDAGKGPFWGEFNTRVHQAMGFTGVVTNGSIRDVDKLPRDILILGRGLRPSHAHVHIVSYGNQVNVFGMTASHGEIVHADVHGAVCFPSDMAVEVVEKAEAFVASERPIMEACKEGTLTLERLRSLYMSR